MNLLLAFIVSMAVTMALIPALERWAGRLHVLDAPNVRKVHDSPLPRVGGIAIAAGTSVALLLWSPRFDTQTLAWLAGAAIVFGFGVWDDRVGLSVGLKLVGQLAAIACVIAFGDVSVDTLTLTERHVVSPWIGVPLTIVFILGSTNAINLADGLDGLAGGTTLLSIVVLGLLALTYSVPVVAGTAFAVAGGILGFLRFNTYPARIFMGDGGSQLLGYAVATLALKLTQNPAVPLSTALPLMLLGLPAVDTLMVMVQRWRDGTPVFTADRRHVHHKLLGLGFDHHEAVVVVYGVQAVFFVTAWWMRYEPDPKIAIVFVLLAVAVVGSLGAAGRIGWRWRHVPITFEATAIPASPLRRALAWLAARHRLPRWAIAATGVALLTYVLAVALLATRPSADVGWLAVVLGAMLLAALVARGVVRHRDWVIRLVLYVSAMAAVYLDYQSSAESSVLRWIKWLVLPLLIASVATRIRLSSERRFTVTTLDVLIVFAAVVVPQLPGLAGGSGDLGLSLLKLVTLLYAVELLADQSPSTQRRVCVGICVFCAIVGFRAFV